MDTLPHIAKFIFSQQTENSETRERIFNLGKALVEELGLDPGVDTLARWMAHYIAGQMAIAENATDEEKTKAQKHCFETVLKLWRHRAYYPNGKRPFEKFDQVFRTLERLDPENPRPYFYPTQSDDSDENKGDVQQWIDIALDIDKAARVWLEYVFHQAAVNATDEKTHTWLENATELSESSDAQAAIHLLKIYQDDDNEETISEAQIKREEIETRIQKLDAFIKFSKSLRTVFIDELKSMPNDETISEESE